MPIIVNDSNTPSRWKYMSAYAIAVKHGYTGSEEEWLQDVYGGAEQAAASAAAAAESAEGAANAQTAAETAQTAAEAARDAAAESETTAREYAEHIGDPVSGIVTGWLDEHITEPVEVVIDDSLSVEGAAADSKAVGDAISGTLRVGTNAATTDDLNDTKYAHGGQWYIPRSTATPPVYPANWPFPNVKSAGRLITLGPATDSLSGKIQFAISASNAIKYRIGTSSAWGAWYDIIDNTSASRATLYRGAIEAGTNIATLLNNGHWYYSYTTEATDWYYPGKSGRLLVFSNNSGSASGVVQIEIPNSGDSFVWRIGTGGSFGVWHEILGADSVQAKIGLDFALTGKTIMGVGGSFVRQASTSVIDEDDQWFSLLRDQFGMTAYNNGLASSAIAHEDNIPVNRASVYDRMQQIIVYHENTDSDVTNGTQYPGETADDDVDYIIIQGGGNDSSHSVPLGEIDSDDPYTFHGALNQIVKMIRGKWPRAKILFLTCFRRWLQDTSFVNTGHNLLGLVDKDYADAMVEAARYNSVACFDAWHDSGLVPAYGDSTQGDSIYAWPWISRENKHLNVDGNAVVMPMIAKRLNLL